MKNSLATSMLAIGITMTSGCATNLSQPFAPGDAMTIPNVESTGTRVAEKQGSPGSSTRDTLVTTNMKAAVIVVGLSEMSRLVDSARGQPN